MLIFLEGKITTIWTIFKESVDIFNRKLSDSI